MKKITYVFATFMLLFVSCNNEDIIETTPASQVNPNTSGMSDSFKDFMWDGIYEIRDGKEVDLTDSQLLTRGNVQTFYEISTIQPNYIYLGSVLTAESINKGVYAPVGFPNDLKKNITISFSLPIKSKEVAPKKSAFTNAIIDAIGDRDFSGKQSQVFSYKMKEFSFYREVKLAFAANVNIGQIFSINTEVNSNKIHRQSALFVDFSQIYFNVAMDIPDDGNIFSDENTRQKYLEKNPVYVNSVNYGRKGIILVESNETYSVLSVAIRAAFNAKIVSGSLSIDAKTEEILKQAEISICIIGGDGQAATQTVKGFDEFQKFIINGGVYSKEVYGVPISFSAGYASDNSMFVTKFEI